MLPLRLLSSIALASAMGSSALICATAGAQSSAIAPRISGPIDEAALTKLQGNVSPRARSEFDKGEASPSTQLTSMRIVLSRSPEQESALERFMAEQLDNSSPNYHRWLTPEQFGKLYGPADSDIAAIVAWLESHGLKVESVSTGRTNIAFSGTVAQVEQAFHTSIHSFDDHGEQFLSNTSDPRIPSALAPVISGIAQLNTIRPRPYNVPGAPGQFDPESHRFVPLNPSFATPDFTNGTAGSYMLYLVPADAATIYNSPNALNANFTSASGSAYDGTGVTIGIVGDALIQALTVGSYRTNFLNDSTLPTITNIAPIATAGGDTDEGYLDVEIAGGLAPKASLNFYTSDSKQNGLSIAINQAVNDNKVDILNVSFGECELDITNAGNQQLNSWWQQAAAEGIAVVVSTGDSGSAGCDSGSGTTAVGGLQVNGFASTPYNIAVGGTDFHSLITGFTTYVNTTNGTLYGSAMRYIPESTWNDSTTIDTTTSDNIPFLDMNNKTNIVAGAGGVSACSTNTTSNTTIGTCTSGYTKPSWQRGAGVPSDSNRDVPDVALFAGNGFDRAAWLVCTDDPVTGGTAGQTANCVANTSNQFAFIPFGGTSTSAPAFAGILALVQQKAGGRLGNGALQNLYNIFNSSHAGAVFHDVTLGNNSVVCTSGTPDCTKNTAGNFFLSGYDTNAGYDLATGMGSVDATQLINNWASTTGTGPDTVTVTPASTNITSIQSLTVVVTVAGSGSLGTPTGTVTLSDGGASYLSSPTTLDATGTASFTIPAGTLQAGSVNLTAAYSGDPNYEKNSGTTKITVTQVTFTLAATKPAAVTKGNTATSTVTVSRNNGYTGTVALSCVVATSPVGAQDVPGCTISPSTPITLSSSATSGTATVTFNTTAPIATLSRPHSPGWGGAGTAVLALLVFLGIPARRRSWRAMLGILIATVALVSLSACGSGGGSSSNGGGNSNPGTTSGTYTYTVTGTGTPAVTTALPVTITLTVN